MRRIVIAIAGVGALLGGVAACGDEDPTGVGSEIIGEEVRTFEVILGPASFLVADTTFDNLGTLHSKPFRVVAREFGGTVDAHTLFRINRPITVTYVDTAGGSRTDTIAAYRDARVTLVIDTIGTTPGPIDLELLDVREPWEPTSATWTRRVDTTGTTVDFLFRGGGDWATPGGTTGSVRGTATWTSGDTLVIPIDSAAAAHWTDRTAALRGALIRSATPDSRLRISSISFDWDVLPRGEALDPDSAATAGSAGPNASLVNPPPPPPPATELRVGGTPSWRALLEFNTLEDLVVSCGAGCSVAVREAVINLATLVLTPLPGGAYRPERPLRLEARAVLRAPTVPLPRSPLTTRIAPLADSVDHSLFVAPTADSRVEIGITGYVRRLVSPQAEGDTLRWLAVVSGGEGPVSIATLGHGSFGSLASAVPPRLRLVLTVPVEEIQ